MEECDGRHDDHPAGSDWFERERTDWKTRTDLRFCPELIKPLLDSSLDHDIGSHTFSHVVVGECDDRELIRAELAMAQEAAESFGVEYDSFVYPRNAVDHRDLLAEFGFRTYRGRRLLPEGWRGTLETTRSTLNPRRIPLSEPVVDGHGLVNVPPSLFLFGFQGSARRACQAIWVDPVVRQMTGAIDRAIREDGIVHAWLHPNDLTTHLNRERMRAIFEYVDRRRGDGLTVRTMADIAREYG